MLDRDRPLSPQEGSLLGWKLEFEFELWFRLRNEHRETRKGTGTFYGWVNIRRRTLVDGRANQPVEQRRHESAVNHAAQKTHHHRAARLLWNFCR